MNVISGLPRDWSDLQIQVTRILSECGFAADTDKAIETVRGTVNVDVYAEDTTQTPHLTYLCECKLWKSAIPKAVVHSFRTVVVDYGANSGFIISSRKFQKGAYAAATNTNIRLLSWIQFQELFVDKWIQAYMLPRLFQESDALIEYTEPINSRIFRKADALSPAQQERFMQLRSQYQALAYLALHLSIQIHHPAMQVKIPQLPIKNGMRVDYRNIEGGIPPELCEASTLREFLDTFSKHLQQGTDEFDRLFGERA